MSHMYFTMPLVNRIDGRTNASVCFKIINDRGEELSIAGDNSCGAMENLGRLHFAVFSEINCSNPIKEVLWPEAEELLRLMAEHLGFEVTKK